MIAFILHRSGLLNASQGNNRGGRTNRLMTWHVLAEIVKDKWEQDGGWMMVLLRQQGIWSVRGTDIKGRHEVSCKSKRGGKKNHHYGSYPHTHNPFLKRKKKIIKIQKIIFPAVNHFWVLEHAITVKPSNVQDHSPQPPMFMPNNVVLTIIHVRHRLAGFAFGKQPIISYICLILHFWSHKQDSQTE